MSPASVDLPEPVPPMMAVTSPGSAVNDTPVSAGSSAPGYWNVTSWNSTWPRLAPAALGCGGSFTSGTTSSTSLMRSAEAAARGSITNTAVTMNTAKRIWMAYCSDASIAPTCIAPASMRRLPNQMISTLVRFIMKNMVGMSSATRRLTAIAVPVTSRLASSKRRLSWAPRSKARITRTPLRPSSSTRLSRSILTCICWNSGTALRMIR